MGRAQAEDTAVQMCCSKGSACNSPSSPSVTKPRPGIHTGPEGLLEDHTATGRQSHGRCRTSLGDERTIRTVPAATTCACRQINHSKCYSSFNQRETEHVYYLYKSEIILCYLLKSHLPHHCKAKGRSWKRFHVAVPPGTLQVAANAKTINYDR